MFKIATFADIWLKIKNFILEITQISHSFYALLLLTSIPSERQFY